MTDKAPSIFRFQELDAGKDGKLKANWQLTSPLQNDPVRLILPPSRVVPIIFVPGIMGSNLADLSNKPLWLLNSGVGTVKPVGLATKWATKNEAERQALLHPARTQVYRLGDVPDDQKSPQRTSQDFRDKGWGEVSESSYHAFLLWLDKKMNGERNPATWPDFSYTSMSAAPKPGAPKPIPKLFPGIVMRMSGLPHAGDNGAGVASILSDDLLTRAKCTFPIYGFGYNWLASNDAAAKHLQARIDKVIKENNGNGWTCTQVILLTHSMGGLVARACVQLPGMATKIVGVCHGVMPATGAAVAYRRCKVGMRDENFGAGLVIGSTGGEVTAVFAQAPGALQLLPSEEYGPDWLHVSNGAGKVMLSLPKADPYDEIYLQKDNWWGLLREEWLTPYKSTNPMKWAEFEKNIKIARAFHRSLAKKFHPKTFVFYGGGEKVSSFTKLNWVIRKGLTPDSGTAPPLADVLNMKPSAMRTTGANALYVGGRLVTQRVGGGDAPTTTTYETSFWSIHCAKYDGSGDGTVPATSGRAPRKSGGSSVIQQFEIPNIDHEGAYNDATSRQVAYYAITKLAALADVK